MVSLMVFLLKQHKARFTPSGKPHLPETQLNPTLYNRNQRCHWMPLKVEVEVEVEKEAFRPLESD